MALGVCEPQASGIGGQSGGLIHLNGRTFAIDGSSRVPSLTHQDALSEGDTRLGYRATTVPSTLATYAWLNQHYGTLPWEAVLEPAIAIARQGYAITELQAGLQARALEEFEAVPSRSGARYFLRDGEQPHAPGDLFRQPELADALSRIAANGVEEFYQGEIAHQIDADMRTHDGFLRADDLALIPWPVEREPLWRRYRGYRIASMPPPGSGRTLLLVLQAFDHVRSSFLAGREPHRYHFLAEVMRKAFLQRLDRPFDPNTYPQMPKKPMLARRFAKQLALSVADEIDSTLPLQDVPGEQVGSETTHFSIMDAEGNTVAMTQSIELVYGSKAAAGGLGFLYNNYLEALELENPAHPYYLRPNAVPWSSASPSIVFRKDEPWLALGSPGSERIFSSVAQFIVDVIDRSATLTEAMLEPRLHCSIGGRVSVEAARFDRSVLRHLEQLGYEIDKREAFSFYLGCIQAVIKCQSRPGFQGVADIRRDGIAQGVPAQGTGAEDAAVT